MGMMMFLLARVTQRSAWVLAAIVVLSCGDRWAPVRAEETRSQRDELKEGFWRPPQAAKPWMYWIWLNGYANREFMDRELKAFRDHGIGGLCIFDMGARGDSRFFPPAGPEFMGEESLETIVHAIKIAKKYGLSIQLAACSSWDLGGSWVTPEQASMALYHTEMRVKGPQLLDTLLPLPRLPAQIPRTADGKPAFLKEVAVLAIPEGKRLPAHEFIFRLPRGAVQRVDHVVLYNTTSDQPDRDGKLHLFAKDFSVAVSVGQPRESDFREVVNGTLQPHTKPQRFDFPEAQARFVRLRIASRPNRKFDRTELGEFEVYSTTGENVVASHEIDRTRDSAEIVWCSSEAAEGRKWTAANLHDGSRSGPLGSWSFEGPPPLVIEDRSRVINLTDRLGQGGRLKWRVPKGRWTLMRFVCANTGERLKVPSPNSDGLATDHLSAEATGAFIRTLTSRLQRKLGDDLSAAGITQLYLPSYEVRGAVWTSDFLQQFQRYRGYDMTDYLPVLAGCRVENGDRTLRFLYDFQKTLGDLLVDAYYRTASQTARQAGWGIEAEAGGPGPPVHQVPVDALKALGAIDEMRGEFWPWRPDRSQLWVVKETACAAHVYGRRRVHMEAFTGFRHWQDGPFDLKPSADRAFCEGMNHVVWHTSSHQPPEAGKPGWVYGAGTHLTANLVWWPMAGPFLDYLSRCSFLLQQGRFVGDVCYYYGDQGANFVPPKHVDPSLGYGYDYDVVNPEVILSRMSVRDGRITLPDGMQYELLVLPERQDFDLEVLRKIEQLVEAGATVVGPKPTRSNGLTDYPARDQKVQQLADRLWGDCDGHTVLEHRHGQGSVVWGRSLNEILRQRGVGPDFEFASGRDDSQLDFIHRQTTDSDIYFVCNRKSRTESITATFRVSGKAPELWLPDSGQTRELPIYEETEHAVRVPLTLDPFGAVFVVFRKPVHRLHLKSLVLTARRSRGLSNEPARGTTDRGRKQERGWQVYRELRGDSGSGPPCACPPHCARASDDQIRIVAFQNGQYDLRTSDDRTIQLQIDRLPPPMPVKGPWRVHFPGGWGAPNSVTMQNLASWTDDEHEGIKYFSGIATYQRTLDIPKMLLGHGKRVYLDLGRLWAVGRVRLNGQLQGVLWKPPYRIDLTKAAHPGVNRLEIDIANTWANRLVGDACLPADRRFCRTNITRSGTPAKPWSEIPLRASGLLGPVQLIPAVEKIVSLSE